MIDLRPDIQKILTPKVIDSIRRAPKPTPVAEVLAVAKEFGGKALTLDATRDFTVLCSNCHRMIHRSEFVSRVEEFRATYVVKGED